jgi:hypothetical protein
MQILYSVQYCQPDSDNKSTNFELCISNHITAIWSLAK